MNISMVGIDHSKASIEYREIFAFTNARAIETMKKIKRLFRVDGCVIISTCNRSEVWVYSENEKAISPYEMLCEVLEIDNKLFTKYFTTRTGFEAIEHLFLLTCGLKSKVWGEDQILTQVKNATVLAREAGCIDTVLERLFRTAITSAKKVKTTVNLAPVDRSVASKAIELLKGKVGNVKDMCCMVIGNGEMGRLSAKELIKEGAKVKMTLRQHKKSDVIMPEGCEIISYDERFKYINDVKVVISATTSPHYTIKYEDVENSIDSNKIFIDLAVPRDIDPKIVNVKGISLYDVDTLGGVIINEDNNANLQTAKAILKEHMDEFENWYYFKDLVPIINDISSMAAQDIQNRISKSINELYIEDTQREEFCQMLSQATYKVVGKLMYGLKDNLDKNMWKDCIEGIEKSAIK